MFSYLPPEAISIVFGIQEGVVPKTKTPKTKTEDPENKDPENKDPKNKDPENEDPENESKLNGIHSPTLQIRVRVFHTAILSSVHEKRKRFSSLCHVACSLAAAQARAAAVAVVNMASALPFLSENSLKTNSKFSATCLLTKERGQSVVSIPIYMCIEKEHRPFQKQRGKQ